jgi:hypothetical protein
VVGDTEKFDPLQIVAVWLGIEAFGFTVTTTVNEEPGQDPEVGVTV